MTVSSQGSRWARLEKHLGVPFIERGLGDHPIRNAGIATAVVAAATLLNIMHYAWLTTVPRWQLDGSDDRFLTWGWESVVGALDLQLLVLLGVGLLVVAPTVACQTVLKEAETRTLDVLLISPLSPRALHNGFSLGALARLVPWLAPALALHLVLGTLPQLSMATTLWTTALLVVGGVAMTSVGTMAGLLLRDTVRGPLGGLVMFVLFALVVGLPLLALGESDIEHVSYLSPLAAAVHAMLVDGNGWLAALESGPKALYEGYYLGLPVHVPLFGLVVVAFWGALSSHVGRRKLEDPMLPAVSMAGAALSLAFIAMAIGPLLGAEYARSLEWAQHDPALLGRRMAISAALTVMLSSPFVLSLALGAGSSAAELRRFYVSRATEGRAWRRPVGSLQLAALGLIPLAVGLLFPVLTFGAWLPESRVEFGHTLFAIVPVAWAIVMIVGTVGLWRLSARKAWQTATAWIFGAGVSIVMGAYVVAIIDRSDRLQMSDLTWDGHGVGVWLGPLLLAGLMALPVALVSVYLKRRASFLSELHVLVQGCMPELEMASLRGAWPEACAEDVQIGSPIWLSPPLTERRRVASAPSSYEGLGRTEASWIGLQGSVLRCGQGDRSPVAIDLARPFVLDVARSPIGRGFGPGHHMLVTLALTQSAGTHETTRLGVGFLLASDAVDTALPILERDFGVLPACDVEPLLATVRFYAEAHGVQLPRIGAAA